MESSSLKELDPIGETWIPGGEDGNYFFFMLEDHITGGKNDLQRLISFFLSLTICQALILSGY